MSKPIIAVLGGTGAQGGGVVDALLERGRFDVRVATRNPNSDGAKALAARGVQIVQADLNAPETLAGVFEGVAGAFVVTNFWDPDTGPRELEVGRGAVEAAKKAGVGHLVWSTLPNTNALSDGKLAVHHFTNKAMVDQIVADAGFTHHTFVEAPFYFQNLTGMMAPQPLTDGTKGWAVPMNPEAKGIYAGDVGEVGKLVARIFEKPDEVGNGAHLAAASVALSWREIADTLNGLGHRLNVIQVPAQAYDGFYPGAAEMREMFEWFEQYSYYGPEADKKVSAAASILPDGFTPFASWAAKNMAA
jgi:uncharacterized protein YbjT (DUF2867 family)